MHPLVDRARSGLTERATDLLLAVLAGATAIAGSYAVAGFTGEFVVAPVAGTLTRTLPAAIVNTAIVVLGDLGKTLNLVGAVALAWTGFATVAYGALALAAAVEGRLPAARTAPVAVAAFGTTLGCAALAVAVTGVLPASAGAGVAAGLVVAAAELLPATSIGGFSPDRRRVLGGTASALAIGVAGYVSGTRGLLGAPSVEADRPLVERADGGPTVEALRSEAESKSLDVAGLEPLISESFYSVDINAADPHVPAEEWSLTVTGDVEEEVTYSYEDVRNLPSENRFASLRCVGEDLNGRKLDTAVWTGVQLTDVLEPAGVPDRCCVMLRASDDYFVEFPLSALRDGFLAYGMNGNTLPVGHGYPVRALIPGRWGEVNVKWIEEIEVLAEPDDGFWEEQGWEGTGPVETVAKLHVENHLDDGRVEVAGHAYAGTRGVDRVEVSTDGGDTWSDATLSEPLPGEDVWRQWVYRYEPPGGSHEVVVRAVDGTGEVQPKERNDSFPSGATGWVSREIDA